MISQELTRIKGRYGDCLQAKGSSNRVKRAYKKLEFSLLEKERVHNLQDKLRVNTERLSLLTALTAQ